MSKEKFLLLIFILFIYGCDNLPTLDEVITDKRTEYRKSEALPDLEVPPDLTTDALNDPMEIPHEEVTTLSEFQKRKTLRSGAATPGSEINPLGDEQWLTLQGSNADIWPKLTEFWKNQGYTIELDDKELGVLETGWLETTNQGISSFRDKFSVIAESTSGNSTVLYISSQRQEKIASENEETEWVDIEKNPDFERKVVSDMNLFFYGTNAPAGTSSLTADTTKVTPSSTTPGKSDSKPKAEILDLGEDKVYLSLPDEFTKAWERTEAALLSAGMQIEHDDRAKGLYFVLYNPEGEKKSLFSKLKFWGDNSTGELYQISLTGVGDKTEMVVLDNKGDWLPKEDASRILTYIQTNYNNALR